MAPILKHGPEMHQGQRLWMLAGTGDGPVLAAALLHRGWRLRVSLVSAMAALAYRELEAQPMGARLELQIGPLEGPAAIAKTLQQAVLQGDPFAAVIDATHPFARLISRDLVAACAAAPLPLLRLARVHLPLAGATVLAELKDLGSLDLEGQAVLLALGGRQLAAAVNATAGALHHARVLPAPAALRLALAAGLGPERIAALRPTDDFAIEAALVQRWGITTIVCRQSGGLTEAGWRQVSARCGCRLVLLARPAEAQGTQPLPMAALLAKLDRLAVDPADGKWFRLRGDPGADHRGDDGSG